MADLAAFNALSNGLIESLSDDLVAISRVVRGQRHIDPIPR